MTSRQSFRPIVLVRVLSLALLFMCALDQRQATAQPILSIANTGAPSGWVVIYNGQGFAASWSQTNRYTNVTIATHLSSFGVPQQTGRAYLTRRLGPGTTVADEIASLSFTFPLQASDVTLFSGVTL